MRGFFSFEALGGEYPLLGATVANGAPTAVFGASDAQKYLIASLFAGRVAYITADALTAKRAAETIERFLEKSDMAVCLVLYDAASVAMGERLFGDVEALP